MSILCSMIPQTERLLGILSALYSLVIGLFSLTNHHPFVLQHVVEYCPRICGSFMAGVSKKIQQLQFYISRKTTAVGTSRIQGGSDAVWTGLDRSGHELDLWSTDLESQWLWTRACGKQGLVWFRVEISTFSNSSILGAHNTWGILNESQSLCRFSSFRKCTNTSVRTSSEEVCWCLIEAIVGIRRSHCAKFYKPTLWSPCNCIEGYQHPYEPPMSEIARMS